MRSVSAKTAKRNREYHKLRELYLDNVPRCEIRWDSRCLGVATEIDHKVRRNTAPHLVLDLRNFQAACRNCHHNKEHNPEEAKERGLWLTAREVEELPDVPFDPGVDSD